MSVSVPSRLIDGLRARSEYHAADEIEELHDEVDDLRTKLSEALAENERLRKDAERYNFVRENIDWLMSDEAGVAGCAFSCHIPLAVIEKASPAELLDAIADSHTV